MFQGHFSENVKISYLYQGAANAVACDIVDVSKFNKGAFVVLHTGAADTDLVLSLYESDDVAGSNTAAITTSVPIYHNTDVTAADVLSATTADYDYTIDTGNYPNSMVVFEIDPSILSQGYPCAYLSDSGGNASNTCTILWVGEPKVKGQTLASAIA
jgi:hypothetical protein